MTQLIKNDYFPAYMAAFFDGEGCIRRYKHTRAIAISQGITPKRPVMKLFKLIKKKYGGILSFERKRKPHYLHKVTWVINKRPLVENFINSVLPYIQLRKNDLLRVLDFYETHCREKVFVDKDILYSNLLYEKIGNDVGCSDTTICRMRREKRDFYYKFQVGKYAYQVKPFSNK